MYQSDELNIEGLDKYITMSFVSMKSPTDEIIQLTSRNAQIPMENLDEAMTLFGQGYRKMDFDVHLDDGTIVSDYNQSSLTLSAVLKGRAYIQDKMSPPEEITITLVEKAPVLIVDGSQNPVELYDGTPIDAAGSTSVKYMANPIYDDETIFNPDVISYKYGSKELVFVDLMVIGTSVGMVQIALVDQEFNSKKDNFVVLNGVELGMAKRNGIYLMYHSVVFNDDDGVITLLQEAIDTKEVNISVIEKDMIDSYADEPYVHKEAEITFTRLKEFGEYTLKDHGIDWLPKKLVLKPHFSTTPGDVINNVFTVNGYDENESFVLRFPFEVDLEVGQNVVTLKPGSGFAYGSYKNYDGEAEDLGGTEMKAIIRTVDPSKFVNNESLELSVVPVNIDRNDSNVSAKSLYWVNTGFYESQASDVNMLEQDGSSIFDPISIMDIHVSDTTLVHNNRRTMEVKVNLTKDPTKFAPEIYNIYLNGNFFDSVNISDGFNTSEVFVMTSSVTINDGTEIEDLQPWQKKTYDLVNKILEDGVINVRIEKIILND